MKRKRFDGAVNDIFVTVKPEVVTMFRLRISNEITWWLGFHYFLNILRNN